MTLRSHPVLYCEIRSIQCLLGLDCLRACVEYDIFIYLLRVLYRIVQKSGRLKEPLEQLKLRIQLFEFEMAIPGCLSALPIRELLRQLEDAQYIYPIQRREINFSVFNECSF